VYIDKIYFAFSGPYYLEVDLTDIAAAHVIDLKFNVHKVVQFNKDLAWFIGAEGIVKKMEIVWHQENTKVITEVGNLGKRQNMGDLNSALIFTKRDGMGDWAICSQDQLVSVLNTSESK